MEWFYANENDEQIPIAEEDLEKLIQQGVIKTDTLIWNESMSDWMECKRVRSDLFETQLASTPSTASPNYPVAPVQIPGEPPPLNAALVKTKGPADGMAVASLVCGIAGLVISICSWGFGLPISIVATVLGHLGRKKLREANLPNINSQLTAGLVLGWVGIGVGILAIIAFILYMIFAVGAAVASEV